MSLAVLSQLGVVIVHSLVEGGLCGLVLLGKRIVSVNLGIESVHSILARFVEINAFRFNFPPQRIKLIVQLF